MAHVKSSGVARGNRDSISKRLGVKVFGGQMVFPGNIIIRQRGTKFHPGVGTAIGNDFTIYALKEGKVRFKELYQKKYISVE